MTDEIKIYQLPDKIVHYLLWCFHSLTEDNDIINPQEDYNINAIKTVDLIEDEDIFDTTNEICNFVEEKINFDSFRYILYREEGRELSNSKRDNSYKFVLFLNDCETGDLVISKNDDVIRIKPTKGKLIFFPSKYSSHSLKNQSNKYIATGYLKNDYNE